MLAQGRGGSIINLSSITAWRSSPRGVHYVASKAGVIGLTRAIALEMAPQRIRVNAIAPGLTDTAQPRYGMSEEELRQAAKQIPLGELAQPEDIAGLAVFLAGDGARQITGQTISVNGGQLFY
jgi:3-oxoacyl-[acyl-carrier protein] reductase